MKELDYYTATFNSTIVDVIEAREIFCNNFYNESIYNKEIQPFIKKGIMSIFHEEPNKFTEQFVGILTMLVNKRFRWTKSEKSKKPLNEMEKALEVLSNVIKIVNKYTDKSYTLQNVLNLFNPSTPDEVYAIIEKCEF